MKQKKKKKRKTKYRIDQRTAHYFGDFTNMSTRKKRERARDRVEKIKQNRRAQEIKTNRLLNMLFPEMI